MTKARMRMIAALLLVVASATLSKVFAQSPSEPPTTRALRLQHSAFDLPEGFPSAVIRGRREASPSRILVFLHGFRGCAEVLMATGRQRCGHRGAPQRGYGIGDAFDDSRADGLLVIPQLALMKRDGSPGRFARPRYFEAFLDEVLAANRPPRRSPSSGRQRRPRPPITLLAHSAGYQTTLAILDRREMRNRVDRVVLFDALYAGVPRFLAWLLEDEARSLVSIHTSRGGPASRSRELLSRAEAHLPPSAIATHPRALSAGGGKRLTVFETGVPHGRVPSRHLADVLGL